MADPRMGGRPRRGRPVRGNAAQDHCRRLAEEGPQHHKRRKPRGRPFPAHPAAAENGWQAAEERRKIPGGGHKGKNLTGKRHVEWPILLQRPF